MEMKVSPEILEESVEKRRISVLGSTGSVGCSTLDLVEHQPDYFEVIALTGHKNVN